MSQLDTDTIAAIATPSGNGGVGIVRVSGSQAKDIAHALLGFVPKPRYASFTPFFDEKKQVLDKGIALYFAAPNSFTGEDVLELQAHGGSVILDMLLQQVLQKGARPARAGEFSERAFINDKLDLTQAEAIADLIHANSEQAARSAVRSLSGDFSQALESMTEALIELRVYVEAAIDFPEEEIDFLADGKVADKLNQIKQKLDNVLSLATTGSLLREGIHLVIVGKPNAGKSSLLNALAGQNRAIVTDIAGTTRDALKEQIQLDGMPVHIIDTAGLRTTDDQVEKIGIERTWQEVQQADAILLLQDGSQQSSQQALDDFFAQAKACNINPDIPLTLVCNKADLSHSPIVQDCFADVPRIFISAKQRLGLDLLSTHLKQLVGYQNNNEGQFIARRRHLDALKQAQAYLHNGQIQLHTYAAGELLAEELRNAQNALETINGRYLPDALLGEIFSSFCIGK